MNERIKELAEAAMATRKHVPPVWQLYDSEMEKFAELIVRMCADLVDRAISDGGVDGRVVKEHFGVEE